MGNKGVVRLGVIETMRGNDDDGSAGSCDDDVIGEGVAIRSGSRSGGPGGIGMNGGANGDGSTRGGGGAVTGADVDGIETTVVDPPTEGVGTGMKMGDDDLFLVILLRAWRSVRSPSRNFWSFRTW